MKPKKTKNATAKTNRPAPPSGQYATRIVVPEPPPVKCPNCGSLRVPAVNGVRVQSGIRVAYRECAVCGLRFYSTRRADPPPAL